MNIITLRELPGANPVNLRPRSDWTTGDFGKIARFFTAAGTEFVARLGLKPGDRLLDVGCGTGNQSIPAALAGAEVTGLDIAPNLLAQARKRAADEFLTIGFDEGNAEEMPYPDASFDLIISMFGAIFAPRHDKVSAELVRICRPGGRIVMANWMAEGFVGQMFRLISAYLPPPISPSPLDWGDERRLRMNFGEAVSSLRCVVRPIDFTFPYSVPATVEIWREYYAPLCQTFNQLDSIRQESLRRELEELWSENNLSANGVTRIRTEYLELTAIRSE
jgi:SAM-dependent methyltransferase